MRETASIILAAGKGTRMKSEKAKVTFPLAGKSLVHRVVNTSLNINCSKICVIVGYKKEDVIQCIPEHPELTFVEQKEQLGTGHAVIMAKDDFSSFNGDVFILCGDVPLLKAQTLKGMLDLHRAEKAVCTVLTMVLDDPGRYGRIVRDANNQVQKITEYRDASEAVRNIKEINTGIYCFDSKSLFEALDKIDNNNDQNEYYLTDVLEIFYKEGLTIKSIELEDISEAAGVNSQEQLAELETEFYQRINQHWMNHGVSIENPSTVLISEDTQIENDVVIMSNSLLKGKNMVHKNSIVGPHCYLENSVVQENAILKGYNILINHTVSADKSLNWQESFINE